jgi:hypothetical protein
MSDTDPDDDAETAEQTNPQPPEPNDDAETAEPDNDTKTAEPDNDTKTAEPDNDTKTAEPDNDTKTAEPDNDTKTAEPDNDTKTAEPDNDARTRRIREYLEYTGLAVLVLFALLAAFRFYGHTSAAISEFISPAYRSLFKALFNLVVLLVSAGGIAVLLARRDRE